MKGGRAPRIRPTRPQRTYAAITWFLIAYCTRSVLFLAFNTSIIRNLWKAIVRVDSSKIYAASISLK
jgi:hypothetical protein